jgi:hypothetical protein
MNEVRAMTKPREDEDNDDSDLNSSATTQHKTTLNCQKWRLLIANLKTSPELISRGGFEVLYLNLAKPNCFNLGLPRQPPKPLSRMTKW